MFGFYEKLDVEDETGVRHVQWIEIDAVSYRRAAWLSARHRIAWAFDSNGFVYLLASRAAESCRDCVRNSCLTISPRAKLPGTSPLDAIAVPTLLERISVSLRDRYQIERELGQGGMATVFLASDKRHERKVAIKVLHPELSAVLGAERFEKEVKLTASLQHPHILPLFDSGVADGLLYYVMPFVDGETLRGKLERERQLPINEAVRLAVEIAGALHYAHERGIVHRDIKPENVLLQNGHAVVADFGIALAVQQAGGQRMTQTGLSLGTPQYMAPEQAMGERNIDARADVYALGAVVYEMFAGEPPFTGPTAQSIVAKVMTERPRALRALRDTVPASVETAVASALEKLPADRPANAGAFANELMSTGAHSSSELNHATTYSVNTKRATSRRALAFGLAGALAGVAAASVWWMNRETSSATADSALPVQFEVFPADSASLRLVCCGQLFAMSSDGRYLVYQATPPFEAQADSGTLSHQLYLRDLTELSVRLLPGTRDARTLFFSPDNTELGFTVGDKLKRVRLSGGEPLTIATLPTGFLSGGSWSKDGHIYFAISGRMFRYDANGGGADSLFSARTPDLQLFGPAVVDDAGVLLYTEGKIGAKPEVLWRSLKSGETHAVIQGATATYNARAKALLLVRADGSLVQYPFDIARGDTTGPAVRLASDVILRSPVEAHAEYTASQTGTVVVVTREQRSGSGGLSFVSVPSGTSMQMRALPGQPRFLEPHFSPDSRNIIIATIRQIGSMDATSIDVARQAPTTHQFKGLTNAPSYTGRGDSILYRVGLSDVYIAAANGSGEPRKLFSLEGWTANDYAIASSGPWLAISASPTGSDALSSIVVAHRDSGGKVAVYVTDPTSRKIAPEISPDGKWIAYVSAEASGLQVYVSTFPKPSGRYLLNPAGAYGASWSSDSRTLYFASSNKVYSSTFTPDPSGGAPQFGVPKLLHTRDPWGAIGVSPDGKTIGFVDRAREGTPKSLVVRLHAVVPR